MPFEAIQSISEAEENAKRIKTEALAEARRIIAEAKIHGSEAIEAATKRAEAELVELNAKADEKAKTAVAERTNATANKIAVMRARGESQLDKAATLIVERIVGG